MTLWFVLLGLSLLFVLVGRILTPRNAPFLLSGYNNLSPEQQQQVDLRAYIRFWRRFHQWLGAGHLIVGSLLIFFWNEDAGSVFMGVCPLLAYVWFLGNSRRYMPGVQERQIKVARLVLLGCALLVGGLMFVGQGSIPMEVSGDALRIGGMYGETLPRDALSRVQLVDTLPEIKWKTNGFATGSAKKGFFRTRDGRNVKLLLNRGGAPYLLLTRTDGQQIYYACEDHDNRLLWAQIDSLMPEKTQ